MTGKTKIFIIEDELVTAEGIRASLDNSGYPVTGMAATGADALAQIEKNPPDLVLADIKIKGGMDGIETARLIHERFGIPVIYLTAYTNPEILERAKHSGSYGYIIKPFESRELVSNIEIAIHKHRGDRLVRESEEKYREMYAKQRRTLGGIIEAMGLAVETRDPYTAGHQRRVSDLAGAIAGEMNMDGDMIEGVKIAAGIHDLGKLGVPAEILSKPARLTTIEFQLIKTHSQAGYEILKNIDFPWPIAETVLQHHERINGTGYPRGLAGGTILPEARILMVADVTEAMASHRPYRPALGIEAALAELAAHRGELYDGDAVDACMKLFNEGLFSFDREGTWTGPVAV